jgi:ribosomal protein S18 acetylase RimI-like enzyme
MDIIIRELNQTDLFEFKRIRLDLLKENPIYFGSDFEEEKQFTDEVWLNRILNNKTITIGCFESSKLIGIVVLALNPRVKMKHIGIVNSMYVDPEYRKRGISTKLMNELEKKCIGLCIEQINLSVTSINYNDISLYEKLGFLFAGEEKNTIKYNGNYYSLKLMYKKII